MWDVSHFVLVPAVSFKGCRIAWFKGNDRVVIELVERGKEGKL